MMLPVQSPTQAPKRKREDDKSCIICYRSCMLEKATLDGCGHSYCKECIQSWIVHRCHQPVCPVCRQPITGYQYEEEQDVTHAADLAQPILVSDDGARVAPATSTDTQLVYSSSTATSNTHEAIPGGNHSVVTDDTAKSLRHVEVHPVPRPTLSAPLQGVPRHHPRHGHHRRTRDGIHHHHHRRPSSTIRPAHARINESEAAALHYRRSVYRQRLHAIPPGESRTTGVPPLASRDVHSARIRTWVTRELQALLDEEDVELLVEFVKGLLVATAAPLGRGGGGAGGGGGVQQTVCTGVPPWPVDQLVLDSLAPFLHDHAAHFWHELCCFASTPYTMATYDRLVRYPAPVSPRAAPVSPRAAPVLSPRAAPVLSPRAAPVLSPRAAPVLSPGAAPVLSPRAAPVSPRAAPVSPRVAPVLSPRAARE